MSFKGLEKLTGSLCEELRMRYLRKDLQLPHKNPVVERLPSCRKEERWEETSSVTRSGFNLSSVYRNELSKRGNRLYQNIRIDKGLSQRRYTFFCIRCFTLFLFIPLVLFPFILIFSVLVFSPIVCFIYVSSDMKVLFRYVNGILKNSQFSLFLW